MPRYLTPHRIGLLLLVEIYLGGDVPTTSKIPILQYLSSRIQLPTSEAAKNASILKEISNEDALQTFSAPLSQYPSEVPGRTLYDTFLNNVWSLTSLDSFHELFERLELLLAPSTAVPSLTAKLSRSSPLGQFIRRCIVEFTRLQFASSVDLWDAFAVYRQSTHNRWALRNPDAAASFSSGGSSALDDPIPSHLSPHDAASMHYTSTDDTDSLIVFSIHQLQKFGARLAPEFKSNLSNWILESADSTVQQSRRHFLSFYENWRAGQYTLALESLHRYFDYSIYAAAGPRNSGNMNVAGTTGSAGGAGVGLNGETNLRLYYQYALLHLSVLHADFGCWEESVDAMDECVATARENHDTACLSLALTWLLYLRQANTNPDSRNFTGVGGLVSGSTTGGEQDEIAFLKARAKDTRSFTMLAGTLLEEAKLEMYSSGSNHRAIEHILQSAYLNIQHDHHLLLPPAYLFLGAYYDRLGQSHLCLQGYKNINHVFLGDCPITDKIRAVCRVAYSTAQKGSYKASLQLLQDVLPTTRGVLKLEQRLKAFAGLIRLLQELRSDNLDETSSYISQLRAIDSLTDPELNFELSLLEVDYLIQSNQLPEAFTLVNSRIQQQKHLPVTDIAHRLHLLVLKGRLFCAAGKPVKAFSISLRAASTAMRLGLISILIEAVYILCNALIELAEYQAVRDLLEAVIPMALESTNMRLTAELFSLLSEAYSGIAGYTCAVGSAEQSRNVRIAEANVERAREAYAQIHDLNGMLQSLSMKARFAEWRGDTTTAQTANDLSLQLLADKAQKVIFGSEGSG